MLIGGDVLGSGRAEDSASRKAVVHFGGHQGDLFCGWYTAGEDIPLGGQSYTSNACGRPG